MEIVPVAFTVVVPNAAVTGTVIPLMSAYTLEIEAVDVA